MKEKKIVSLKILGIMTDILIFSMIGWMILSIVFFSFWGYSHIADDWKPPLNSLSSGEIVLQTVIIILFMVIGIISAWHFKRFMNNLVQENFFSIETINHIQRVGYGLIFMGCIDAFFLKNIIRLWKTQPYSDSIPMTFWALKLLFIGIMVLGISRAFCYGKTVHEENSLTI